MNIKIQVDNLMASPFTIIKNSNDPILTIIELFLKSENEFLLDAGKILYDFLNNQKNKQIETIRALNKLNILESPSADYAFLFFMIKSLIETHVCLYKHAALTLKKAAECLSKSAPSHIRLWHQIFSYQLLGSPEKYANYLKAIGRLNLKNNLEYYLWRQLSHTLSCLGILKLDFNKADIRERFIKDKIPFKQRMFVNEVNRGHLSEAKSILSEIPLDQYNLSVIVAKDYLAIYGNDYSEGDLKINQKVSTPQVLCNEYFRELGRENPKKALGVAKELVELCPSVDWPKMVLADAEIVNKNIEAAEYLIDQAHSEVSFLHTILFSRIEYQKGNISKSADYFQYCLEEYDRLGLVDRFKIQIKLAIDLKAVDVLTIMQEIQSKKSVQTKLALTEIINNSPQDKPLKGVHQYIGSSVSSLKVKKEILQIAKIEMPVLIIGETGVGKEVVAQAIHDESNHSTEPFLPINCGAIVGGLLQSELFGHVAGAFTSAQKKHIGLFEAAGEGTVFLDELGEMSHETQVALLRVLDSQKIRPIGSSQAKKIHCRVIAATNANLTQLVSEGIFRSDLYYRLKSLEIDLKPLKERKEDIVELALYFFNVGRCDSTGVMLDQSAKEILLKYTWPGNTRELKNEIHKVRVLSSNKSKYSSSDFLFLLKNQSKRLSKKNSASEASPVHTQPDQIVLKVNDRSTRQRIQIIKGLFKEHKILRRVEIINTLKVAPKTVTKDLKELAQEGFIKKVTPTSSSRTHYFELK